MNNLLFTHPHFIPNLNKFLSYVKHKIIYFVEPNSCWSPLNSIVGKKYYGSLWGPSTVLLPVFFKISSFVVNIRKKLVQVWNDMRGELSL